MVVQWFALSHRSKNDAGLIPGPGSVSVLSRNSGFLPQWERHAHSDRPTGNSVSSVSVNASVNGKWMDGWMSLARHLRDWGPEGSM